MAPWILHGLLFWFHGFNFRVGRALATFFRVLKGSCSVNWLKIWGSIWLRYSTATAFLAVEAVRLTLHWYKRCLAFVKKIVCPYKEKFYLKDYAIQNLVSFFLVILNMNVGILVLTHQYQDVLSGPKNRPFELDWVQSFVDISCKTECD